MYVPCGRLSLAQLSRVARIRQLKTASSNAFMNSKRRADLRQAEDGDNVSVEDLFQMQHHHLLTCLEHTTVSQYLPSASLSSPVIRLYPCDSFYILWSFFLGQIYGLHGPFTD